MTSHASTLRLRLGLRHLGRPLRPEVCPPRWAPSAVERSSFAALRLRVSSSPGFTGLRADGTSEWACYVAVTAHRSMSAAADLRPATVHKQKSKISSRLRAKSPSSVSQYPCFFMQRENFGPREIPSFQGRFHPRPRSPRRLFDAGAMWSAGVTGITIHHGRRKAGRGVRRILRNEDGVSVRIATVVRRKHLDVMSFLRLLNILAQTSQLSAAPPGRARAAHCKGSSGPPPQLRTADTQPNWSQA